MARGRKKYVTPRERVTVYIEEPLLAKTKLLLFDPVRQQAKFGGWTDLINELLKKWVAEQSQNPLDTEEEKA